MTSFTKNPHPQPKNFFSSAVVVGQNLGTNISYACSQSVKNIFCYFMLFHNLVNKKKGWFCLSQLFNFFKPWSIKTADTIF